jgi:transposase
LILDTPPKGRTFDIEHYLDNILTALVPLRPKVGGRKLVIPAENARVHRTQLCILFCTNDGLRLATHPLYSPDLALSGFFWFGHVKHILQGMAFASHEELLAAIGEIVTYVPKERFHRVFENWIERLE